MLWSLIAQFANHLNFIRAATLRNMSLRQEIIGRQSKIRDAIGSCDEDLAEKLWRSYLLLSEEALVAAMKEFTRPEAGEDATAEAPSATLS